MRFSKVVLGGLLSLSMAATVLSGVRAANAAESRTVATRTESLSPRLVERAGRYVHLDATGHGSLSPAASRALSSSDLALVKNSLARYNAVAAKQGSSTGTVAQTGSRLSPNTSSKVHGPTCGWHISWQFYWYGWTVKLNGCLVDWLTYAAGAVAGVSALFATIQAYLDIPADVAAIVAGIAAAGAGLMALQLKTCQQLGYHGGVTYNSKLGVHYPGCY